MKLLCLLAPLVAFSCGGSSAAPPQKSKTPAPSAQEPPTDQAIGGDAAEAVEAELLRIQSIENAVAAKERPEEDRARDADRKPAEVLSFFQVEPGMAVVDLIAGTGYYTDILSRVVGETGKVYAHNNKFVLGFVGDKLTKRIEGAKLSNVVEWNRELEDLEFEPASLDGAVMVLFYHDTIWQKTDRAKMNASVFAALKPGGFYGVVDHVAADGAGDVSKSIHRMDPALIASELKAAGFVLEEESDVLRHPEDARTMNVFDPAIRGKTDRVVYRFRKPPK